MKKLFINGMNCKHCKSKITNALNEIGANIISFDLEKKIVTIETDKSNEEIIEIIGGYGFDVDNIE